jgi:uncharacterized protein YbjT (DUF2867 family)
MTEGTTLVLGGTGKTGRRVVERLRARGLPVRVGSRSGEPAFDWHDPATWGPALEGASSVYVSYHPDLVVPGAPDAVEALAADAAALGARRLVLLSGRGEEEALKAERRVMASGLEWTLVRCSWFNQNFSEGSFTELVQAGELALPTGDVPEPFVDADDIADVAVAALTDDRHAGEVYELSGPRLLLFEDALEEISRAAGREVGLVRISPKEFEEGLVAAGVPGDAVWLMSYLFRETLDGRNASLADGVQRALGRPPRDFRDYAREAAATGVWARPAVRR